jgi:hypothetical protein
VTSNFGIRESAEPVQDVLKDSRAEQRREYLGSTSLVPDIPTFGGNPSREVAYEDVVRTLNHLFPVAPPKLRKAVCIPSDNPIKG